MQNLLDQFNNEKINFYIIIILNLYVLIYEQMNTRTLIITLYT